MRKSEIERINERLKHVHAGADSLPGRACGAGYGMQEEDQKFMEEQYQWVFSEARRMNQNTEIVSLLLRKFSPVGIKRQLDESVKANENKTEAFVFMDDLYESDIDFMLEIKQREDPAAFRRALRATITILSDFPKEAEKRVEKLEMEIEQIYRTRISGKALKALKSMHSDMVPSSPSAAAAQTQPEQKRR